MMLKITTKAGFFPELGGIRPRVVSSVIFLLLHQICKAIGWPNDPVQPPAQKVPEK